MVVQGFRVQYECDLAVMRAGCKCSSGKLMEKRSEMLDRHQAPSNVNQINQQAMALVGGQSRRPASGTSGTGCFLEWLLRSLCAR